MDENENLDLYDGNPVHDFNVDYDCHINSNELNDLFEDSDLEELFNNLSDWD